VGSRFNKQEKEIALAYIAGFLDGDGSLMLQVKKRKDSQVGIRFMATICFYQDTRHAQTLHWIREVLGIGYISIRNDGMTELRINGYKQVRDILAALLPYIRFKALQAQSLIASCDILSTTTFKKLSNTQKTQLVDLILVIQSENYMTKKKKTREEYLQLLHLTP
jgi:hypothetical protein